MPFVAREGSLQRIKAEILAMRRGGGEGHKKPHKLIMLLAVIDLADDGLMNENKIFFDGNLLRHFENYFRLVASSEDWCQPGPPFFHLRTSSFWHHHVKPGKEQAYAKLKTSGGGAKRIVDNIEYAYLSEDAYEIIRDPESRQQLRELISLLLNLHARWP